MLRGRLLDLFNLLCENMDNAILSKDQAWVLTVIEMVTVLSEFIDQNHKAIARTLPTPIEAAILNKRPVVETATFGGGCYWGIEKLFNEWGGKTGGIIDTTVGFMGTEEPGNIEDEPSYEEIASGDLGHIEVI